MATPRDIDAPLIRSPRIDEEVLHKPLHHTVEPTYSAFHDIYILHAFISSALEKEAFIHLPQVMGEGCSIATP